MVGILFKYHDKEADEIPYFCKTDCSDYEVLLRKIYQYVSNTTYI